VNEEAKTHWEVIAPREKKMLTEIIVSQIKGETPTN
jgi:hypothetical protein